ncbi:epidermal retinol dehydrogenase 2-like isoform X2 [Zonotrichia leucophrys gambelii]|uniref:epidermal retinol dehydrogenase 2-like isoform X2 n=1 Tax=Zonotrichia leucophrys gambelii TaxID=257770 RepID=UPI0031409133
MFNFRCIQKLLQYIKFFIFLIIENAFCLFSLRKKKYFAGEIVLITGSANGIGRLVALKLAPLGVTLVLWDIDDEGNKETSRLAQQNGANRVFVYHCDCSRREEVYEQADKTCKAFLPAMVACNRGHLINTASGGGIMGLYRQSDYGASKAAIIAMMEAINSELHHGGKHGIKTTIICPYFISTRLSKGFKSARPCLFPVYDPEYAASRIVDAIKKEKFYLIMPPAVYLLGLKIFLPRKAVLFLESYVKFPESMEEAFGQKKKD